jgi:peroxiredoxin
MTDVTTYAFYPVFRADRTTPAGDLEQDIHEVELLVKEFADRATLRGSYSTVGFRPDADLLLWLVGSSPNDLQDLVVALRRTALGRRLELTWSFLGVVRPAEFAPDHVPNFVRGAPPLAYVCVYPYVRTEEWYLLPPSERGALLREHGEMGREFPEVLANTTSNFGIGDWEWILAFESDQLHRIVDCIRRLRDSASRRYTKVEVPFVTGIRKELADALRDLA